MTRESWRALQTKELRPFCPSWKAIHFVNERVLPPPPACTRFVFVCLIVFMCICVICMLVYMFTRMWAHPCEQMHKFVYVNIWRPEFELGSRSLAQSLSTLFTETGPLNGTQSSLRASLASRLVQEIPCLLPSQHWN